MINKELSQPSACPKCSQEHFDSIGTALYCLNCGHIIPQLEEEVRVVPSKYESNLRNGRALEEQRKLNKIIAEFTQKYRQVHSLEEQGQLRSMLQRMREAAPRSKGLREAAAVVVFHWLGEQARRSLREYCAENDLSIKIFHQKYKLYKRLSEPEVRHVAEEPVKHEEKLQEDPTEKSYGGWEELQIGNARKAVHLLYDALFPSYFYQQKRRLVCDRLIELINEVPPTVHIAMGPLTQPAQKTYYLLFAVLKSLDHRIRFEEYAKIVCDRTNYLLKRKAAAQVRKIYEQSMKGNVKIEPELGDNGPSMLGQSPSPSML